MSTTISLGSDDSNAEFENCTSSKNDTVSLDPNLRSLSSLKLSRLFTFHKCTQEFTTVKLVSKLWKFTSILQWRSNHHQLLIRLGKRARSEGLHLTALHQDLENYYCRSPPPPPHRDLTAAGRWWWHFWIRGLGFWQMSCDCGVATFLYKKHVNLKENQGESQELLPKGRWALEIMVHAPSFKEKSALIRSILICGPS